MRPEFEHRADNADDGLEHATLEDVLKQLSDDGWEVVSVVLRDFDDTDGAARYTIVSKRPK